MKWSELSKKYLLEGGDVESHRFGWLYRGRIRSTTIRDGKFLIYVDWVARFNPNGFDPDSLWEICEHNPNKPFARFSTNILRPEVVEEVADGDDDNPHARTFLHIKIVGGKRFPVIIYPQGLEGNLNPKLVVGLKS